MLTLILTFVLVLYILIHQQTYASKMEITRNEESCCYMYFNSLTHHF